VSETFEEIASTIAATGSEQYAQLTSKVVPSLMGAFDVATLTEENALANLSAELLAVLAESGTTPMPPGLISTVMPRLNRLLLGSQDEELLKSATSAVKHMLSHDPEQVFNFQDQAGKGGLEVILIIIDRLLNPAVDDNGAAEVGGLAAEVVEKAGSERLGPYLMQLLRAVAARLATAKQAAFIQSLILVFARLSLNAAQDVVNFLADVDIQGQDGLHIVISKWLENSITFAGYEDIRQK
jgi:importin-9